MKKIMKLISFVLVLAVFLCGCDFSMYFPKNYKKKNVTFQDNPIDRNNFKSSVSDPGIEASSDFESVKPLSEREITEAADFVIKRIDEKLMDYTKRYPSSFTNEYVYSPTGNKGWTGAFWTGMLWLAYEYTRDTKYLSAAASQCEDFRIRLEENRDLNHHDIGFLYYLSCVKGYEITGLETMRRTAIKAADKLLERYNEKGKYIQAWGTMGEKSEQRLIIDTMMNIELLYWAGKETGDDKYTQAAYEHARTTGMVIIRPDASTHHTYYINPETGNPSHGETSQGFSDDSAWSRGQAWGMYGFSISYRYTGDEFFMEEGTKISNYFLNHLPSDKICYWDLNFTNGKEPRDSSAAAIAASALLSWSKFDGNQYGDTYTYAAHAIIRALSENYTTADIEGSNSVLKSGVYSKPSDLGINESMIWGDYYYMEALMKLRGLRGLE